jgi:CBS domain-containing protein
MKIRELMTRDPDVLTPEATVGEAARLMRKLDVGIIPVVDDPATNHLQGVITDRDITIRHVAEDHAEDCPVSDHMTVEVRTVPSDESHHDVMRAMRSQKVRRVPVVDEDGRLVGIVSQADLAVDTGPQERDEVKETLEAVSQPARPERAPR